MVGKHEFIKILCYVPTRYQRGISRLDQLFIENKYHPINDTQTPLSEVLAIPLEGETEKTKESTK